MKVETFTEYREATEKTVEYPTERGVEYCTYGLAGETSETHEKVRSLDSEEDIDESTAKEFGDVLWYMTRLTVEADEMSIEDVVSRALEKVGTETTNTLRISEFQDGIANNAETRDVRYHSDIMNTQPGHIQEKRKKEIRDGREFDMTDELSEVLVHVTLSIEASGYKLENVVQNNVDKLLDRKERDVIKGEGDDR
ncbi:MAG: MazG nucleotide pyrophosphohydrolase domain-containing protein [Halobacteria archaeon]|nr:MazG nucleotide pyrophosphohydrolase domain-containing protein [Halobacteria archaeon]